MNDSEMSQVVVEEAVEILEEMEKLLLELEINPQDLSIVAGLFRAVHTIKGSAGMFGFDSISEFAHHVESVLDLVRNEELQVSVDLISLVLASKDHIYSMLAEFNGQGEVDKDRTEEIIVGLHALSSVQATLEFPAPQSDQAVNSGDKVGDYHIHLTPKPSFFQKGGSIETILTDLKKLGKIAIVSSLEIVAPEKPAEKEDLFWDILLTTNHGLNKIRELLLLEKDQIKFAITDLSGGQFADPEYLKLGEILVNQGDLSPQDLHATLEKQKLKPLGELLTEDNLIPKVKVQSALAQQKFVNSKIKIASQKIAGDSVRVSAEKLDQLVNLVGELVITQSSLTELSDELQERKLLEPVKEVTRLTSELRDCALKLRMLPIGTTFSRFKRLVRDLSSELGKKVEMISQGAATELDKAMIDKLGDPLIHLIRNSLDHGLETPEERMAIGKPQTGVIELKAVHAGAKVIISIRDDGRGIDPDKIRAKAIDKGLIAADESLDANEILQLIFTAGFSTAATVTNVSGRGVGMDVVSSTVKHDLKGTVDIASEKGVGTTITIALPLTLAIIDGLLIMSEYSYFVLPLGQVEKCVELSSSDIREFHGRNLINYQGQLLPYIRLRTFYGLPGVRPELEQICVVEIDGEKVGLAVDEVIGGHQTVLKSLGWACRNAEGVSGATILGSGEVALIVDLGAVRREALKEEARAVIQ